MRNNRFAINTVVGIVLSLFTFNGVQAAATPETEAVIHSERPAVEVMFVLDTRCDLVIWQESFGHYWAKLPQFQLSNVNVCTGM